jgi:hypothetical protein
MEIANTCRKPLDHFYDWLSVAISDADRISNGNHLLRFVSARGDTFMIEMSEPLLDTAWLSACAKLDDGGHSLTQCRVFSRSV